MSADKKKFRSATWFGPSDKDGFIHRSCITGNSSGSAPASHMPRFTLSAIARRCALHGDGVVLMCGCDKTTPSLIMGAASCDVPATVVSGGPMLNGKFHGRDIGSGTDVWRFSEDLKVGLMTQDEFTEAESCISRSAGHCMTMGTAAPTMGAMAEALGRMYVRRPQPVVRLLLYKMATSSNSTSKRASCTWRYPRKNSHAAAQSGKPLLPIVTGGYRQMYIQHVMQASDGADLDFLVGCRGTIVTRESH